MPGLLDSRQAPRLPGPADPGQARHRRLEIRDPRPAQLPDVDGPEIRSAEVMLTIAGVSRCTSSRASSCVSEPARKCRSTSAIAAGDHRSPSTLTSPSGMTAITARPGTPTPSIAFPVDEDHVRDPPRAEIAGPRSGAPPARVRADAHATPATARRLDHVRNSPR